MMVATMAMQQAKGADWKKQAAPLMTRWAKDVTPENALPEYPRPQMVRKDWMNLNGVWEFAPAAVGENVISGQSLKGKILVPYPMESALSGVMKHFDRSFYRRTFEIPKEWAG